MKFLFALVAAALIPVCVFANAATEEVGLHVLAEKESAESKPIADAPIEKELSQKLKAIQTFSAEFSQLITDPSGEEIQRTTGNVKLKRPGLFLWQVYPPYEQLVVANKQFLWVYDPDLEQVTISDRQKMDNSPAQILSGDFSSLGQKFTVVVENVKGVQRYHMRALAENDQTFTDLYFEFSHQQLSSMRLIDRLGQSTAVIFSKQIVNSGLPDSLFEFSAPEGVDTIVNE